MNIEKEVLYIRKRWIIFTVLFLIAVGLLFWLIGSPRAPAEASGFTGEYAISENDDRLLYVINTDKGQEVYVRSEDQKDEMIYQSEEQMEITTPLFTEDERVMFVETTGAPEEPPGEQEFQRVFSNIVSVDIENDKSSVLLEVRGWITTILQEDPDDSIIVDGVLVSTDEEPVTVFQSYESSLFTLDSDKELERIRTFDAYSPGSLQLVDNGNKLRMVLPDDYEDVSSESMFESTERIYEMDIEQPDKLEVLSKVSSEVPISSFITLDDNNELIYQTIMNWEADENYEYDLVEYDAAAKEEGSRLYVDGDIWPSSLRYHDGDIYYAKRTRDSMSRNTFALYHYDRHKEKEEKITLSK